MTKIFKFIFGLIMLSVFVAGMGIILIMSAPQVAGMIMAYMEHLR